MKIAVKTLPAGEVAYLLRRFLGPHLRSEWSDFLTDCRVGRTSIEGLVLLPLGKAKNEQGYWRPVYLGRDVIEFIEKVRATCPGWTATADPMTKTLAADALDERPWKMRRLLEA
jgi:hypothetical protein